MANPISLPSVLLSVRYSCPPWLYVILFISQSIGSIDILFRLKTKKYPFLDESYYVHTHIWKNKQRNNKSSVRDDILLSYPYVVLLMPN
jgi:hypothetical protein